MLRFEINKDGTGHVKLAEKSGGFKRAGRKHEDMEFFRNQLDAGLGADLFSWNVYMTVEDTNGRREHELIQKQGNQLVITFKIA